MATRFLTDSAWNWVRRKIGPRRVRLDTEKKATGKSPGRLLPFGYWSVGGWASRSVTLATEIDREGRGAGGLVLATSSSPQTPSPRVFASQKTEQRSAKLAEFSGCGPARTQEFRSSVTAFCLFNLVAGRTRQHRGGISAKELGEAS